MKKKYFIFAIILILVALLALTNKVDASTELDRIVNYEITVDPRMNDGSLDITYDITWKVLDSDTEGPLSWVKIGTPNENFTEPTALTGNIKSISAYNGAYVRIDFTKPYYAGEQIRFKYSIHEEYMYTVKSGKVKYAFTPAWFTDAFTDNMIIRWNAENTEKADNNFNKDGNYLIWKKSELQKGEKMTANVEYKQTSFSAINEYKQVGNAYHSSSSSVISGIQVFCTILIVGVVFIIYLNFYGRRQLLQS